MPLVFGRDLPYLVVPFRALVVCELAAGHDFGHLGLFDPLLELDVLIVVDRDDSNFCFCQIVLSCPLVTAASS